MIDLFLVLAWMPKTPILGRNRNLIGSPCLLSTYVLLASIDLLMHNKINVVGFAKALLYIPEEKEKEILHKIDAI